MARGKKPSTASDFTEVKQFSSLQEMETAIQKLRRRIEEVQSLQTDRVPCDDQRVKNAEGSIRASVLEIFGPNSPEYGQIREESWWGIFVPEIAVLYEPDQRQEQRIRADNQAQFQEKIPQTVTMLQGLIQRIEEKRPELGANPEAKAKATLEQLELHPRVADACADTFRDGHYREAVLNASIALVNYVKERSRQHSLDGSGLMTTVFSANKPVLAFNELKDQTDKDEQEGLMHLFMGAVLALRNPRAHALYDDSPEMALDYIAFLSMLAKRLDGAKRL